MKPNRILAETLTPDGGRLVLYEHDRAFCIRLNGQQLMHSSVSASELLLGELAAEQLPLHSESLCLLGGLGLGFTLKSFLKKAGPGAKVQVAELIPAIVDWNRTLLLQVNGALLEDPRVDILLQDASTAIVNAAPEQYDAIALDLDNGPIAMVQKQNSRLYGVKGLQRIARALKPGGHALFWSAGTAPAFAERLAQAGFQSKVIPAPLYAGAKRCAVSIYVAEKSDSFPPPHPAKAESRSRPQQPAWPRKHRRTLK